MPVDFVVRSHEHSNGSEYGSVEENLIPDHYVKRLWRKRLLVSEGATAITFANKDTWDNEVNFSSLDEDSVLIVKGGKYRPSKPTVARVDWIPGATGKALEKSILTIGNKSGPIKDLFKRSKVFGKSRIFVGSDGIEYKWKFIVAGQNPTFPEASYWTLFAKDSEHPIATTERLVERDQSAESYPVYISERGLTMQDWIITTLVILEKLQK